MANSKRRGSRRQRTSSPYPSEAELREFGADLRARVEKSLAIKDDDGDITESDLMEIFLARIGKLEREVLNLKAWQAEVIANYAPT
jgi:hypothetical protein